MGMKKEKINDEVACARAFFSRAGSEREIRSVIAVGVLGVTLTVGGLSVMCLDDMIRDANVKHFPAEQIEKEHIRPGVYGFGSYALGLFLLYPGAVYYAGFRYGRNERLRGGTEPPSETYLPY